MTGGLLALYVRAHPLKDGLRRLQVLRRLSSCLFTAAGLRGSRCERRAARHTNILCTQSRSAIPLKQHTWQPQKGARVRRNGAAEHGRYLQLQTFSSSPQTWRLSRELFYPYSSLTSIILGTNSVEADIRAALHQALRKQITSGFKMRRSVCKTVTNSQEQQQPKKAV